MNRRAFQKLADERLQDAILLLAQRRYGAAYYLAGYAVECALKACIAKRTRQYDFPPRRSYIEEIYTHDLKRLVKAAHLDVARVEIGKRDDVFAAHWDCVIEWSEESRYGSYSRQQAQRLLQAVADEEHGVLQWVKQSW